MKTFGQFIAMFAALALLSGLGYCVWLGLEQLVAAFAALDAQVVRVTAIASLTVLLAAFFVASAVRRSGQDRLAVPLREEKAATYRLFVDCWQQRLNGERTATIEDGLNSLDRMLSLFGSGQLVSAHLALRALVQQPHLAAADWVPLLGGALLQIRNELNAEKLPAGMLEGLITSPQHEATTSADTKLPVSLSAA